jgi:hypothetical protein
MWQNQLHEGRAVATSNLGPLARSRHGFSHTSQLLVRAAGGPSRRASGVGTSKSTTGVTTHHWGHHPIPQVVKIIYSTNLNEQCMLLSITQYNICAVKCQVQCNKGHTHGGHAYRSGVSHLTLNPYYYAIDYSMFSFWFTSIYL